MEQRSIEIVNNERKKSGERKVAETSMETVPTQNMRRALGGTLPVGTA
jgi:hypothetical protein